jgi:hypothetical protein
MGVREREEEFDYATGSFRHSKERRNSNLTASFLCENERYKKKRKKMSEMIVKVLSLHHSARHAIFM